MEITEFNQQEHTGQVVELWRKVFGYNKSHSQPELSICKKMVMGDGLFFVAIENQQVIGTVMAGYDGHRGWIYSLAVSPAQQKRGIGSRLLAHAEEQLTRLGCMKINLQIMPGNESVQKFYESNGFKAEKRISMGKIIEENIPD